MIMKYKTNHYGKKLKLIGSLIDGVGEDLWDQRKYTTSVTKPRFGISSKFLPIIYTKISSSSSDLAPNL